MLITALVQAYYTDCWVNSLAAINHSCQTKLLRTVIFFSSYWWRTPHISQSLANQDYARVSIVCGICLQTWGNKARGTTDVQRPRKVQLARKHLLCTLKENVYKILRRAVPRTRWNDKLCLSLFLIWQVIMAISY